MNDIVAPGWYCDKGAGTQRVKVLRHRVGGRVVFIRESDPLEREVRCTVEQFRMAFVEDRRGDERPADGDRFECPFCRLEAFGPHEVCGGSFTDTDHPSAVRPVFIPASEDADVIAAEARARYR